MIIKNLSKFYGETKVVDDVSFEIPRGKITSLIGPNGAGKIHRHAHDLAAH